MDIAAQRSRFVEIVLKQFQFLIDDYGFAYKGYKQGRWKDQITYQNLEVDRKIVVSNQYHGCDYGFEVQVFQPSENSDPLDRDILIYYSLRDQDDDGTFVSDAAKELKAKYEKIIAGKEWVEEPYSEDSRQVLRKDVEDTIAQMQSTPLYSAEFKRKKTIYWLIRVLIAVILYAIFWEHEWVRWTLWVYVPLTLFALLSIWGWQPMLNRKIRSTRKKLDDAEKTMADYDVTD